MAAARRKRRDRRDEVHAAAVQVFYAKGFAGASMQDVADAVGVLKGSLYHYVDSKDQLLREMFRVAAEVSAARMAEVDTLDITPVERLRLFIERQVLWALEHPELSCVLVREWRVLGGAQRKLVEDYRLAYEAYVGRLLADCVAARAVEANIDVAHALNFVLAPVDAVAEWFRPSEADSASEVARVYADLVVRAIATDQVALHAN